MAIAIKPAKLTYRLPIYPPIKKKMFVRGANIRRIQRAIDLVDRGIPVEIRGREIKLTGYSVDLQRGDLEVTYYILR